MIELRLRFAAPLCALLLFLILPSSSHAASQRLRIAVPDFGGSQTGLLVSDAIRTWFNSEFQVIDRDLATSAARGAGYNGQLNVSRQEARDLGSAIGCDFYFIGDAQSFLRSSSVRGTYYETYASIFLVSARSGRLILWERPAGEGKSTDESNAQFITALAAAKSRYVEMLRKAFQEERTERAAIVSNSAPLIEVLSEDNAGPPGNVQAPRPYRRLKPTYPEAAARGEVEATVDALVDIDAHGEVVRVEIDRWAGYGLEESVIATVKQLHFFPAMRDGVPIPLRVLLRYNFRKPAANSSP